MSEAAETQAELRQQLATKDEDVEAMRMRHAAEVEAFEVRIASMQSEHEAELVELRRQLLAKEEVAGGHLSTCAHTRAQLAARELNYYQESKREAQLAETEQSFTLNGPSQRRNCELKPLERSMSGDPSATG